MSVLIPTPAALTFAAGVATVPFADERFKHTIWFSGNTGTVTLESSPAGAAWFPELTTTDASGVIRHKGAVPNLRLSMPAGVPVGFHMAYDSRDRNLSGGGDG
jgi:hypothetical protein